MSYYDDERPRRQKSTRERTRRDDYDDTVYDTREARQTSLVRRRDDSVSSVEEVTRDFPPGDRGGGYYRETTVRKSGHRPVRSRSIDDDTFFESRYDRSKVGRKGRDGDSYVSKRSSKRSDVKRDRRSKYDSDSYSSRSRTPPRRERRKSGIEEGLAALGLGGVAAKVLGKSRSESRSRSRDRARSRSRAGRRDRSASSGRSRARSKSKVRKDQIAQALKAAVLAGATEAFRARKEPGGWGGEKGKRILTAAISAGGVDGVISNNRDPHHHGTRDVIGSAIAGLATNRIVNGPRSKSRGRGGSPDGRGRSQSRGGFGDLAAGGIVAATAKKAYDSIRSRSRGRQRSRSSSYDSYDSRSPPRRQRSRSRSVVGKGLAAIGLKDAADKVDPDRRRSGRYDEFDDRSSRNGGNYGYGNSRDVGSQPRSMSAAPPRDGTRARSLSRAPDGGRYAFDTGPHHNGDPNTDSDSDLGSSSGDEKEMKQGRKKQLITAGLATVATIHAGHSIYQSMEKREARRKAVKEGELTKSTAKKMKNQNRLQDAASIGIAALGIKGAYSEWQEMREHEHERKEQAQKIERHRIKREARRRKASELAAQNYKNSGYTTSMPNLIHPGSEAYYSGNGPYSAAVSQTHYYDDNPYSAYGISGPTPAPPAPLQTGPPQPYNGFPPPPMGVPRTETR